MEHRLPSPTATHPSDRWESLFVYSFIQKFLPQLKSKTDFFESCMDFENALVSSDGDEILRHILAGFILKLKPSTKNLGKTQITGTIQSILHDHFKSPEQTVFWDDEQSKNVDPFAGGSADIFASSWDLKLKILRQLVELLLCHCPDIKETIDRAWGVVHNNKHKKKEDKGTQPQPPPTDDPLTMENLQFIPLGQDTSRMRYWVVDDSPRVYTSSNPWKISASFKAICSTREEYVALIATLKANAPTPPTGKARLTRIEAGHIKLAQDLEDRLPAIDAEAQRISRVRRRLDQKAALVAQAELREMRTTRRRTVKSYAYEDFGEEDDGGDDYQFQDEEDQEDFDGSKNRRASTSTAGTRRSTRNNGHRNSPVLPEWRGERRSARLGAPADGPPEQGERPRKRARTADSTASSEVDMESVDEPDNGIRANGGLKKGGVRLKENEVAVESVAGKKRSKFWVYAVENDPTPNGVEVANGVGKEPPSSLISNGDRDHSLGASTAGSVNSQG